MAIRKPKDTGYAPWKCDKCGAWIFTLENLHWPLCSRYRENPEMVAETLRYYESIQSALPKIPVAKTRKKRKSS